MGEVITYEEIICFGNMSIKNFAKYHDDILYLCCQKWIMSLMTSLF